MEFNLDETNFLFQKDTYLMVDNEGNPETGIYCVAFTRKPAIEHFGIALNKVSKDVQLSYNQAEQIIYAPLIIPNKPILQREVDEVTGEEYEYTIVWSEERAKKDWLKLFRTPAYLKKTNWDHKIKHKDGEAYVCSSWIVRDPNMDCSIALGMTPLRKNTVMMGYHVPNKELFEELRKEQIGLSLEGFFSGIKLSDEAKQKLKEKYTTDNKMEITKNTMKKQTFMSRVINFFKSVKLMDLPMKDGKILNVDDTTLVATIDGQPVADGIYEMEDGSTIEIKDNTAVAFTPAGEVVQNDATLNTDANTNATANANTNASFEQGRTTPGEIVTNNPGPTNNVTPPVQTPEMKMEDLVNKITQIQNEISQLATLKSVNDDMKVENDKLKAEADKLKEENAKLSKKAPAAAPISTAPIGNGQPAKPLETWETLAQVAIEMNRK